MNQPKEGLEVLHQRAKELDLDLVEVESTGLSDIKLGVPFELVDDGKV